MCRFSKRMSRGIADGDADAGVGRVGVLIKVGLRTRIALVVAAVAVAFSAAGYVFQHRFIYEQFVDIEHRAAVDDLSHAGLVGLTLILQQRTAVEAGSPMAERPVSLPSWRLTMKPSASGMSWSRARETSVR